MSACASAEGWQCARTVDGAPPTFSPRHDSTNLLKGTKCLPGARHSVVWRTSAGAGPQPEPSERVAGSSFRRGGRHCGRGGRNGGASARRGPEDVRLHLVRGREGEISLEAAALFGSAHGGLELGLECLRAHEQGSGASVVQRPSQPGLAGKQVGSGRRQRRLALTVRLVSDATVRTLNTRPPAL